LPKSDGRRALAEVILREAAGRLSVPLEGTARGSYGGHRVVMSFAELRKSPRADSVR
jgi:hypothetical protein